MVDEALDGDDDGDTGNGNDIGDAVGSAASD